MARSRTSIFAVFADESHGEGYVGADWRLRRWINLEAELGASIYGEACVDEALGGCEATSAAFNADLRANLRLGPSGRYRVTAELERTGALEGGLTRLRVASAAPLLGRISAVADLDLFLLDAPDFPLLLLAAGGETRGRDLVRQYANRFTGPAQEHVEFAPGEHDPADWLGTDGLRENPDVADLIAWFLERHLLRPE